MKKSVAFIMVACMVVLAISGCGGQSGKIDEIKSAGELVMLTNAYFPPFEFIGDDQKITGVDVMIAQTIADKLGVKLNIVDMEFDGIVGAVQAGKGDIGAAGMTIKPDRLESVDFSPEYYTSSQYMIVKADDTSVTKPEDLAGKIIGVQSGTTGDLYATDELPGMNAAPSSVERYKTGIDAAMALLAGKLDAVIIDELPARAIVAENAGLKVVEQMLTEESYAIAVPKGDEAFKKLVDEVLGELIASGKIDEWVKQYSMN
ncbi:MAG: transporter substrate-binding domain-containing protein [Bacillota bacterium]